MASRSSVVGVPTTIKSYASPFLNTDTSLSSVEKQRNLVSQLVS